MAELHNTTIKILRRAQVQERTGLSCSTLYAKLKFNAKRPAEFDATFPKPVRIGAKAVGWVEAEVDAWLAAQVAKSRSGAVSREPAVPVPTRTRRGAQHHEVSPA